MQFLYGWLCFRKHVCGTSLAAVSASLENEDEEIKVHFCADTPNVRASIEDWRQTHASASSRCIIIFDDSHQAEINRDSLKNAFGVDEDEDEKVFRVDCRPGKDVVDKLNFVGCHKSDVLIILNLENYCEKWLHNRNLAQMLVASITRAEESLAFIVKHKGHKRDLENLRDDKSLSMAELGDDEKVAMEDRLEKLFQSNNLKEIRECASIAMQTQHLEWLGKILDDEDTKETVMKELFYRLLGKRKSSGFLKELAELIKNKQLGHLFTHDLIRWLRIAYQRGHLEYIEWRLKNIDFQSLEKRRSKLSLWERKKADLLYHACYHGSSAVIEHCLNQTLPRTLDLKESDIREQIFEQKYDAQTNLQTKNGTESLLSLVTKTNKDPQSAQFLLQKLTAEDHVEIHQGSLRQAFKWSIRYRNLPMVLAMLQGGPLQLKLKSVFVQVLNDSASTDNQEFVAYLKLNYERQLIESDENTTRFHKQIKDFYEELKPDVKELLDESLSNTGTEN